MTPELGRDAPGVTHHDLSIGLLKSVMAEHRAFSLYRFGLTPLVARVLARMGFFATPYRDVAKIRWERR